MTNALPLNTVFLITGIVFLLISVIGQSKIGFAEINPGIFGRIVALVVGSLCLILAVFLTIFPSDILLDLFRNILVRQV